ncbi:MAG: hypothetical protein JWO95_2267, partial [Verrucomicrobiales bacterium]|nr:hypothetical protein [Verrucomicrobiales bacterium]
DPDIMKNCTIFASFSASSRGPVQPFREIRVLCGFEKKAKT